MRLLHIHLFLLPLCLLRLAYAHATSFTCSITSPDTTRPRFSPEAYIDVLLVSTAPITTAPPFTACFHAGEEFRRCIRPHIVIPQNRTHRLLPRLFRLGSLCSLVEYQPLQNVHVVLLSEDTNQTVCVVSRIPVVSLSLSYDCIEKWLIEKLACGNTRENIFISCFDLVLKKNIKLYNTYMF